MMWCFERILPALFVCFFGLEPYGEPWCQEALCCLDCNRFNR